MTRCPRCGGSGFDVNVMAWEIEEYGLAAFNCSVCDGTGLIASPPKTRPPTEATRDADPVSS